MHIYAEDNVLDLKLIANVLRSDLEEKKKKKKRGEKKERKKDRRKEKDKEKEKEKINFLHVSFSCIAVSRFPNNLTLRLLSNF